MLEHPCETNDNVFTVNNVQLVRKPKEKDVAIQVEATPPPDPMKDPIDQQIKFAFQEMNKIFRS